MPNSIDVGKCPFCKDFMFLSETEMKRHKSIFHCDQKECKLEHCCHFLIKESKDVSKCCNLRFKPAKPLKEHKVKEQHIQKKDGAKKKKKGKPKDGQSQLRIDNLFVPSANVQAKETNIEEEANDEDEADDEIDDDSNDHGDDGDDNAEDDDDDDNDGECESCKLLKLFESYRR